MIEPCPILAFGYQSRVGKNSCADFAEEWCKAQGISVGKVAFADALKFVAAFCWKGKGLQAGQRYEGDNPADRDAKLKGLDKSAVEVWIELGQKLREIDGNVWVDLALQYARPDRLLLISDLRFPNEMAAVKRLGGWCVEVSRPGNPVKGSDRFLRKESPWDARIANDSTLESLQDDVAVLCRTYLEIFETEIVDHYAEHVLTAADVL